MVFHPEDHDKGLVEVILERIVKTWPHSYPVVCPRDQPRVPMLTLAKSRFINSKVFPSPSSVKPLLIHPQSHTTDQNILLIEPRILSMLSKYAVAVIIATWLVTPAILLLYTSNRVTKTILYFVFTMGMSLMVPSVTKMTKYNLIMVVIA